MSSKSSKHVAYKWDTKKTSELIQHLEMYPELWNCNLKEYRDRFKKDRALKIISETLQVSVPEINRKFHNLRCQMNSEIRKMNKRKKKSGDGATDDSMHTSQWEYFERLKFLIGIYKSTKSIGTSELSDAEKDANNSIPLCIFEQENDTIIKSTSGCAKKRKCTVPNNTQKEREQDTRKQVTHVMNKPSDDYSIFGEFVASELRQLHSEEKRRKLKRIIQMAIIEVGQEEEWEICPPQSTPSSTPLLHFSPDEGGN